MVDMALHQILPAALHYSRSLCESINVKNLTGITCRAETELVRKLSVHTDALYDAIDAMKGILAEVPETAEKAADYYHSKVVPAMADLRHEADILESITDKAYWPYPTYSDLLYY